MIVLYLYTSRRTVFSSVGFKSKPMILGIKRGSCLPAFDRKWHVLLSHDKDNHL